MARGSSSSPPHDGGASPFEMLGTSRVTDAPQAGDPGKTPALGDVAPVGGGRAVPVGVGGTVAGESDSPPADPGRTPTTGARPPPGAGRTSTLMDSQPGGAGVHPSPLDGQRLDGAPPFGPPRVEAVGSSSGTMVGGTPAGRGSNQPMDALSLEEEEWRRRELPRALGATPDDVARAPWQRATRDHWLRDAPPAAGGSGPSLHGVGGVPTQGLPWLAADTTNPRHLAQVLRDAAEEASTAASDGTPILGRGAAVALALAAAQGPSPGSASAGGPAPPEPGSGTSGGRPPTGGIAGVGFTLTVAVAQATRPTRSRSQRAADRRRPKAVPSRGHRRRRHARRDRSPPSPGPPS